MKEYIAKAVDGKNLTQEEAKKAMEIMLSGEATQAQIAAFLTAMRMKGETLEELIGLASVLRDKAETITPKSENYVDLVGTGRYFGAFTAYMTCAMKLPMVCAASSCFCLVAWV